MILLIKKGEIIAGKPNVYPDLINDEADSK